MHCSHLTCRPHLTSEPPCTARHLPLAVPGRRRLTIDLARDARFSGIYTPSMYGNMSQCEAMAWNTERIPFGTAIAPIYARTVLDFAQSAAK